MVMTHPPSLQIQNFLMKNRESLNSGLIVYKMNDIEQVEKMKDLGVTFDNQLIFHSSCNHC